MVFKGGAAGAGAVFKGGAAGTGVAGRAALALLGNHRSRPWFPCSAPCQPVLQVHPRAGPAGDLAVELARVAGVSPRVRIGSYPNTDLKAIYGGTPYRVKIQLESRDPEALYAAVELVQSKFETFEL